MSMKGEALQEAAIAWERKEATIARPPRYWMNINIATSRRPSHYWVHRWYKKAAHRTIEKGTDHDDDEALRKSRKPLRFKKHAQVPSAEENALEWKED